MTIPLPLEKAMPLSLNFSDTQSCSSTPLNHYCRSSPLARNKTLSSNFLHRPSFLCQKHHNFLLIVRLPQTLDLRLIIGSQLIQHLCNCSGNKASKDSSLKYSHHQTLMYYGGASISKSGKYPEFIVKSPKSRELHYIHHI